MVTTMQIEQNRNLVVPRRTSLVCSSLIICLAAVGCSAKRDSIVSSQRVADKTADQPTECPVHHVAMLHEQVPMYVCPPYGYPSGYLITQKKEFPNTNRYIVKGPGARAVSAETRYCPKCRVAEAEWRTSRNTR